VLLGRRRECEALDGLLAGALGGQKLVYACDHDHAPCLIGQRADTKLDAGVEHVLAASSRHLNPDESMNLRPLASMTTTVGRS
jgi:hypothetical protein